MEELNSQYWSKRYEKNQTGWDLGGISPPIKAYIDQLINKDFDILIPGCGRGYEGIYLWKMGFKKVYFADFSPIVLDNIKAENPDIPENQFIYQDFFTIEKQFDN